MQPPGTLWGTFHLLLLPMRHLSNLQLKFIFLLHTFVFGKQSATQSSSIFHAFTQDIDENESLDDECSIAIKDGDEEWRGGSSTGGATNAHGLQIVENKEGKFSRSHSTGHSIAWTKGEEDKHTLILPEHVKAKITRGHNWSCTTFGDYSGYRNKGKGGVGEVSGFSGSNEDNV
ncbi:uncharacterized protein LOC117933521 isoform X3 [Vitis riparia]|uniref:uncharacterized protein LOC117933521 isoform X3 n=1 Tax=Vitis riparia TaxID=96939 RepID=UPI00155A727C|nr:uncharacterized protein LOC117933521 isoform X3 [Vitis riparia]